MRSELIGAIITGLPASGFSLLDLLLAGSGATMGGVVPGVLARVFLRCVLGFLLRMRRFVGFVAVGTAWGGARASALVYTPSVAGTSPSIAASGRSSSTASITDRSF